MSCKGGADGAGAVAEDTWMTVISAPSLIPLKDWSRIRQVHDNYTRYLLDLTRKHVTRKRILYVYMPTMGNQKPWGQSDSVCACVETLTIEYENLLLLSHWPFVLYLSLWHSHMWTLVDHTVCILWGGWWHMVTLMSPITSVELSEIFKMPLSLFRAFMLMWISSEAILLSLL